MLILIGIAIIVFGVLAFLGMVVIDPLWLRIVITVLGAVVFIIGATKKIK